MIKFDKPTNLNGAELLTELNSNGVAISVPPFIDGNGFFWLDVIETDIEKTKSIVEQHNGTIAVLDKSLERAALLTKLGITEDEARLLLS